MNHYTTIAKALAFIQEKQASQPTLEEIAAHVKLSPFHLQRLFTTWAGVSPKKFLQYLSVERSKALLRSSKSSLVKTAYRTGLSGTGRLHDLFMTIEGMTPGEYKNGGQGLTLFYSLQKCAFGNYLVASTDRGVCNIIFYNDTPESTVAELQQTWPQAKLSKKKTILHNRVQKFFDRTLRKNETIHLHVQGTPFQLKVWQALLSIPEGDLASYTTISTAVGKSTAQRAVGTAIGDNPVAYLIPCHRVIKSTGIIGQYHWGPERKQAMIGWEASRVAPSKKE